MSSALTPMPSAPPRVTHISILHRWGDIRIFRKQCRALAAAGHDVHLIAGGSSPPAVDGVLLHPVADDGARPVGSALIPRLLRAARLALALRPSVYHLHDPHLIPLGLLLKRFGHQVVYDVHEDYPAHARTKYVERPLHARAKALLWAGLERLARARFDAFVCASPALTARFPARRTVVVGNLPLHLEFEAVGNGSPRPRDARGSTVIYTGAISRVRGFEEICRAFELLPDDLDPRLRLVGPIRDEVIARLLSPGRVTERVELVPFQPYEQVLLELRAAAVALVLLHPLPNHLDPMRSNKLFEYMAAGLPVVATDLPAWRELICRVGCGLVVDVRDPAAIADAVEYLLRHPAEAAAMGARGRHAVWSGLNWDESRRELLSLYRDLAGSPVPAPEGASPPRARHTPVRGAAPASARPHS